MKKKALCALVVLLCCWAVDATASTLTEDEALQIVKNSRIVEGLSNTDVNFYIAEVDTIINNYRCPVDVNTITEAWVTDNTPKWLVFVDEEPTKAWRHNCNYYYLPQNISTENIFSVNGYLPPRLVNLRIVEKHTRDIEYKTYSLSSDYRARRSMILPNPLAQETEVVLIGSCETVNDVHRTWNDISSIYKVLTSVYNIPKQNIHVAIGGNPGMEAPELCNIPHDLDQDGIDENVKSFYGYHSIFDSIANRANPERIKHLFVFYGGESMPIPTGLNNALYSHRDYVLQNHIASINPIFANLFCVCNGATQFFSSDYSDLSFTIGSVGDFSFYDTTNYTIDPIVKHWVEAHEQVIVDDDTHSVELINTDLNNDGIISLDEVISYISNCNLEPAVLYHPDSVVLNSSFNKFPLYTDLYIRDNNEDTGIEPNMTISNGITWNSPDIWIRNQDDGETNQFDDCLSIRNGNTTKYIYVRIHNKGGRPYTAGNKNVKISWGGIDLMQYPIEYCEAYEATTIPLDMDIEADSSVIVKCPIYLSEDLVSQLQANGGIASIGVTALVSDRQWYWGESPDPVGNVTDYNDLAFKKCLFLNPVKAMSIFDGTIVSQMYSEATIPFNINCEAASIEIIPDVCNTTNSLPNNLTLSLSLSSELYNQWVQNGSQSSGFSAVSKNKFRLSNTICTISEVFGTGTLFLKSKVLSAMTPANDFVALYHIIAKDENGNIIDGASVNIKIEGDNTHITGPGDGGIVVPGIGFGSNNNGQIQLSAKNVTKPSEYNWYDMDDNNIGNDETITILPEECENVYYLSVKDIESGNVGFAAIDLCEYNIITGVKAFGDGISIQTLKPAILGTVVRVTSVQDCRITDYSMSTGEQNAFVDNLSSGIYVISLIYNGEVMNSLQISK